MDSIAHGHCGERRTLAWFIARRPGGSIAGAIAYRHLSIQMVEGYAGTSDSGFRAEVESEQALARGEHLLAMIDRHEHTNLAGPAATEATRRLEQLGQRAHFRGTVITDERHLRRLMARDDPAIYPDKYVTCVHTHATALCQQRHDQRGTLRPDIGTCKPLSCRNVALTADNIDNLRAEKSQRHRSLPRPPRPGDLMTSPTGLPFEPQVRQAFTTLVDLAQQNGHRPSVLALARQFGLSNTTFRRHYPEIVKELREIRRTPAVEHTESPAATEHARIVARNAKLWFPRDRGGFLMPLPALTCFP
jgi:hypothetical protein